MPNERRPLSARRVLNTQERDFPETLSWGSTEWGNAVSKSNVEINSGKIVMPAGTQWSDDFEGGSTGNWNVNDFSADTSRARGTYSALCDNAQGGTYQAYIIPTDISGGNQISKFEFYWNESSGSYGGGVRLINSNGNVEVGFATDNPQWILDDANGKNQVNDPGDYGDWTRVTFTFDWSAGEYSPDIKDTADGDSYSGTRTLKQGIDVERIQVDDYSGGSWQPGGSIKMWFDDFLVKSGAKSGSLTGPTQELYYADKPDLDNMKYERDNETIDLKAIGSPGQSDEEVITITLDGSSSAALNWSQEHKKFRLKAIFSRSNISNSPTFTKAELSAP